MCTLDNPLTAVRCEVCDCELIASDKEEKIRSDKQMAVFCLSGGTKPVTVK